MDRTEINKADIQRLVAYGLQSDWVRHIILRIESPNKAREFIRQLLEKGLISDAGGDGSAGAPPWRMNISFSYEGMQRLDLNKRILVNTMPKLAQPFVQGATNRAHAQGDVEESSAQNWEPSFESHNSHLVLTLYGNEKDSDWNEILDTLLGIEGASGLDGWCNVHLGRKRAEEKEVFGFKDGVSQPYFRGVSREPVSEIPETLKFEPGDLLLGYANSSGENFWDDELLPDGAKDFFRNGTFAALRKMKQDLALFNSVTKDLAEQNGVEPEYVRAKLFGRWPNGAVVKPGEKVQPATSLESENNFDFSDDKNGFGCPFGSHIRRINHRNSQDVFPYRHRAIQRRGLPYLEKNGEEVEEGLLALFICSSLQNQYEFVMGDWVEGAPRMHSGAGARASDPVVGNQTNGVKEFEIPREKEGAIKLTGLRQFTTTKGMVYLFYPSMAALRRMAILDAEDHEYVYAKKENADMALP